MSFHTANHRDQAPNPRPGEIWGVTETSAARPGPESAPSQSPGASALHKGLRARLVLACPEIIICTHTRHSLAPVATLGLEETILTLGRPPRVDRWECQFYYGSLRYPYECRPLL